MVYMLLAPGFEELEALAPVDILRRGGEQVALIGTEGMEVCGGHGITVRADLPLEQVRLAAEDALVLPGGLGGMRALEASPAVMALVREAAGRADVWLCALCASPTILGRAGLLEGRRAVCYPGMEGELTGARCERDSPVVVDGRLITGRAAGASMETGLALLAALRGADCAERVRREMCIGWA